MTILLAFFWTSLCMGASITFFGPLHRNLTQLMEDCQRHPALTQSDSTTCDKFLVGMLVHSFYDNANLARTLPGTAEKVLEQIHSIANATQSAKARRSFYRAILLAWLPPKSLGFARKTPQAIFDEFTRDYDQNVEKKKHLFLPMLLAQHPQVEFYNVHIQKALLYRAAEYFNVVTRKDWSMLRPWVMQNVMPSDKLNWSYAKKEMAAVETTWDVAAMRSTAQRVKDSILALERQLRALAAPRNPDAGTEKDPFPKARLTEFGEMMNIKDELDALYNQFDATVQLKASKKGNMRKINAQILAIDTKCKNLEKRIEQFKQKVRQSIKSMESLAHTLTTAEKRELDRLQTLSRTLQKGKAETLPPSLLTQSAAAEKEVQDFQERLHDPITLKERNKILEKLNQHKEEMQSNTAQRIRQSQVAIFAFNRFSPQQRLRERRS